MRSAYLLRATALLAFCAAAVGAQETAPGPLVSGSWLQERLGDPGIVILHLDSRRDGYDAGHIPGARFVAQSSLPLLGGASYEVPPVEDLDAALEAVGIGDDVHVVIAARSVLMATRAWVTLDYLGHGDHTSVLDGGTTVWQAEGRPLATDTPATTHGSLTPRPRPEILADADWIVAHLEDADVAIIDGRREEQYTGEDGGMGGQLSAGHMPGAEWLAWESMVDPDENHPVFLPLDRLRTLFEEAGATGDRAVVSYCTIGTRASFNYFVGRLLGYDMRYYEGSWHEWSALNLPFVAGPNRR